MRYSGCGCTSSEQPFSDLFVEMQRHVRALMIDTAWLRLKKRKCNVAAPFSRPLLTHVVLNLIRHWGRWSDRQDRTYCEYAPEGSWHISQCPLIHSLCNDDGEWRSDRIASEGYLWIGYWVAWAPLVAVPVRCIWHRRLVRKSAWCTVWLPQMGRILRMRKIRLFWGRFGIQSIRKAGCVVVRVSHGLWTVGFMTKRVARGWLRAWKKCMGSLFLYSLLLLRRFFDISHKNGKVCNGFCQVFSYPRPSFPTLCHHRFHVSGERFDDGGVFHDVQCIYAWEKNLIRAFDVARIIVESDFLYLIFSWTALPTVLLSFRRTGSVVPKRAVANAYSLAASTCWLSTKKTWLA